MLFVASEKNSEVSKIKNEKRWIEKANKWKVWLVIIVLHNITIWMILIGKYVYTYEDFFWCIATTPK